MQRGPEQLIDHRLFYRPAYKTIPPHIPPVKNDLLQYGDILIGEQFIG
jgi:hypothetical protein